MAKGKIDVKLICGLVLLISAMIMCAMIVIYRRWRLKKQKAEKHTGEAVQKSMGSEVSGEACILIFCDERHEQTVDVVVKSAWMLVGRGTLGPLFKALLPDGSLVALRQLNPNIITACKRGLELQERLRFVGSIRHERLLSLRCCFSYAQHIYLVHDYICLGSLADLLHGKERIHLTPLNWKFRACIALCTARAVAAIHNKKTTISGDGHQGDRDVVCGVVKSSNVMVRRDFTACLSGYEMPHLTDSATIINRNAGYVAPELLNSPSQSPIFTHKSDVYSFGVVLLELLTGRRAAHLQQYVRGLKIEDQNLEGVFDSRIAGVPSVLREMNEMMHIAQQCLAKEPEMRPTMARVVVSIKATTGSSDHVSILPPKASTSSSSGSSESVLCIPPTKTSTSSSSGSSVVFIPPTKASTSSSSRSSESVVFIPPTKTSTSSFSGSSVAIIPPTKISTSSFYSSSSSCSP